MVSRTGSRRCMRHSTETIQLINDESKKFALESEKTYRPSEENLARAEKVVSSVLPIFNKPYLVNERILADRSIVISAEWSSRGVRTPTPVINTLHIAEAIITLYSTTVSGVRLIDTLENSSAERFAYAGIEDIPADQQIIQSSFITSVRKLIDEYSGCFLEGYRFMGSEIGELGTLVCSIISDAGLFNSKAHDLGIFTDSNQTIVADHEPFVLAAFFYDWLKQAMITSPVWKTTDAGTAAAGARAKRNSLATADLAGLTTTVKYHNFKKEKVPEFLGYSSLDVIKKTILTEAWFSYLKERSGQTDEPMAVYERDPKTKKIVLNSKLLESLASHLKNELVGNYLPFIRKVIKYKKKMDMCVDAVGYQLEAFIVTQAEIPLEFRTLITLFEDELIKRGFIGKARTYVSVDDVTKKAQYYMAEVKDMLDEIRGTVEKLYSDMSYSDLGTFSSYKAYLNDTPFIYRLEADNEAADPLIILSVDLKGGMQKTARSGSVAASSKVLPWSMSVSPTDTRLRLAKRNVEDLSARTELSHIPTEGASAWHKATQDNDVLIKGDLNHLVLVLKELCSFYNYSLKEDSKNVLVEKKTVGYSILPPSQKAGVTRIGSANGYCTKAKEFTVNYVDPDTTADIATLLLTFTSRDVVNKSQDELRALYTQRIELLTGGTAKSVVATKYNDCFGATRVDAFTTFLANFLGNEEESKIVKEYYASMWLPEGVTSSKLTTESGQKGVRYDPPVQGVVGHRAVTVPIPMLRTFLPKHVEEYFVANPQGSYAVGISILENSYLTKGVDVTNPPRITAQLDKNNANIVNLYYTVDLAEDVIFSGRKAAKTIVSTKAGGQVDAICFDIQYPTTALNRPPLSTTRVRLMNSSGLVPICKAVKNINRLDVSLTPVENAMALIVDELRSFIGMSYAFNFSKAQLYKPMLFARDIISFADVLKATYDVKSTDGYAIGIYSDAMLDVLVSKLYRLANSIAIAVNAGVKNFGRATDAVIFAEDLYKDLTGITYSEKESFMCDVFPCDAFDAGLIESLKDETWNPIQSPSIVDDVSVQDLSSIASDQFTGILKAYIIDYVDTWIRSELDFGVHSLKDDGIVEKIDDYYTLNQVTVGTCPDIKRDVKDATLCVTCSKEPTVSQLNGLRRVLAANYNRSYLPSTEDLKNGGYVFISNIETDLEDLKKLGFDVEKAEDFVIDKAPEKGIPAGSMLRLFKAKKAEMEKLGYSFRNAQ